MYNYSEVKRHVFRSFLFFPSNNEHGMGARMQPYQVKPPTHTFRVMHMSQENKASSIIYKGRGKMISGVVLKGWSEQKDD